jgi:hypothetical protein
MSSTSRSKLPRNPLNQEKAVSGNSIRVAADSGGAVVPFGGPGPHTLRVPANRSPSGSGIRDRRRPVTHGSSISSPDRRSTFYKPL